MVLYYERTWPEAWTWMFDALDLMARIDENPGMMHSIEMFHERTFKGSVFAFMMPRCHNVKPAAKAKPKGEPYFFLNSGKPRIGLQQNHAVTISHPSLLDRSDVGLSARVVFWRHRY